MSLTINTWTDNGWATACSTDVQYRALPEEQDCYLPPYLSQVCDIYITPDNSTPAAEPFTWSGGVPSAKEAGIDNTDVDNSHSKQLAGAGGVDVPEEVTTSFTIKRVSKIKERVYTLTFQTSVREDAQREFLRQLQQGQTNFVFWYATLGGQLYGPEAGIRPSFVNAQLPLGAGDSDEEVGTVILQWISDSGDPIRNANPYAA